MAGAMRLSVLGPKGGIFVPHHPRTEGRTLLLSPLMLSPVSSASCTCWRACQGGLVTTFRCHVCSAHAAKWHHCHLQTCHRSVPVACVTLVAPQIPSPWCPQTSSLSCPHRPPSPWYPHRRADLGVLTDPVTLVSPQTCSPWCPCRPCRPSVFGSPITSLSLQTLSLRCPLSPHIPSWCPHRPHHLGVPADHSSVPVDPLMLVSPLTLSPQCPCKPWCPQRCHQPITQSPAIWGHAVTPRSPSPSTPNLGLHLRLPAGASHGISTPQLKQSGNLRCLQ